MIFKDVKSYPRPEPANRSQFKNEIIYGSKISIEIFSDPNIGVPNKVYYLLNSIGHRLDNGRQYYLGWIVYSIDNGIMQVSAIQSDVLERTSERFIKRLAEEERELIRKHRSVLKTRHKRWIDKVLQHIETIEASKIILHIPGLREGQRLIKLRSAALRNNYIESAPGFFQK